jgi:hypothetical protein
MTRLDQTRLDQTGTTRLANFAWAPKTEERDPKGHPSTMKRRVVDPDGNRWDYNFHASPPHRRHIYSA